MSTPYKDIYDLFFGMTSDYEFLQLPIIDQDEILHGWLLNAIGAFTKCKTDLSDRDEGLKQFNQSLKDKEKRILAKFVLVEWLSPKLYTIENLKNHLSTKDFNIYSPANLLKEIRETHTKALSETNKEMIAYAHSNFNPGDLLV
jgi:hypothetical protein